MESEAIVRIIVIDVGLVCFIAGFLVADFLVYRRRNRSDLILRKTCTDVLKGTSLS